MRPVLFACFLALLLPASVAHADALFTFESTPEGTSLPLSLTSGGLRATFGGQGTVCDTSGLFAGVSGNAVIQNFCGDNETGPLRIALSNDVLGLRFNFATAGDEDSILVNLFEGTTLTGTGTFDSAFSSNDDLNGEGVAELTGNFNLVTISSSSSLAIDNVDIATPEPSSLLLLATGAVAAFGVRRRRA